MTVARTSLTDPLRIAEVRPHSRGLIGMTICPGKRARSLFDGTIWERNLETDLDEICRWADRTTLTPATVVTLMEQHELESCGVAALGEAVERRGMTWHHLPIPDGQVPDDTFEHRWSYTGHVLRQFLTTGGTMMCKGGPVLIHCRGGLGRTGLVAARLLAEFGCAPRAAIDQVRAARLGAIETPAQEAHVRKTAAVDWTSRNDGMGCLDTRADRLLGCLLGGAVGDAFGYAIEFLKMGAIRDRFGPAGLVAPEFDAGRFIVSDDTQMTLFTGAGLTAALASGDRDDAAILSAIRAACLAWLQTQGPCPMRDWPRDDLRRYKELWARRAPGMTCQSALASGGHGTPGAPINTSKGCGGVMRVAPLGLVSGMDADRAFRLAAEAAAQTHGHPSGYLSAGALAGLIHDLAAGASLDVSLDRTRRRLITWSGHEETLGAIDEAVGVARAGLSPDRAFKVLGEGWVGEEALAVALYAVMTGGAFERVVQIAANHDGDSDSTASIAGQIWGATHGLRGIPNAWIRRLDVFDPLCDIASRLLAASEMQEAWPRPVLSQP